MYKMKKETSACEYVEILERRSLLALLHVLHHFEINQNFEECHKIKQAIHITEIKLGTILPTKLDKKAIQVIKEAYRETYMSRLNYNAKEMLNIANDVIRIITVYDNNKEKINLNQIIT